MPFWALDSVKTAQRSVLGVRVLSANFLNTSAIQHFEHRLQAWARTLCVEDRVAPHGTRIVDCGVQVAGGMFAGRMLAEVCLAGRGETQIVPGDPAVWPGPAVSVSTDMPLTACLGSQYAGWPVNVDKYFGMGSGPMRAARGRESILQEMEILEQPEAVIGVLEASQLPDEQVCVTIAEECGVKADQLTLLVAPTSSIAGAIQVVARSLETALHKMHEIKFDMTSVLSGLGVAPLPPISSNDLVGIGRTNDAVLYGGQVTLWVNGDDKMLSELGPLIPSSSSSDYGRPFAEIFEQYNHDFYKIDPLLFSPAVVTLLNLRTGNSFRFGKTRPEILGSSFGENS